MALNIETFNNLVGGHSLFKAIGHPIAAEKSSVLLKELEGIDALSLYDPYGFLAPFAEIYPLQSLKIQDVYVQRYEDLNQNIIGFSPKLISSFPQEASAIFIVAFDAEKHLSQIKHLLSPTIRILSLDAIKLPESFLTNTRNYLDPLNFATNFAFFRQEDGISTRLTTVNYWSSYSGKAANLWLRLIDHKGKTLATWTQDLGRPDSSVVLDSRQIQKKFNLPDFYGQLFLHVIGAAGHDIVKYALDIASTDHCTLSCTHDANAWPADLYAGLPAPRENEKVLLWVQNSHPCSIPSQGIGLNQIGNTNIKRYPHEIPPFGSVAIDVASLLPELRWPQQIEIQAGKYFVRPRYEIVKGPQKWIAHANVERTDLKPDPELPKLEKFFGKGFLLPAPILPHGKWRTYVLPTPMATTQAYLPLKMEIYDLSGNLVLKKSLGRLNRSDSQAFNVLNMLEKEGIQFKEAYGHINLLYDFTQGEEADGWLHALFRYDSKEISHAAETSFGAHIFNTVATYKNQPQSYRGRPPGLTTKLFLRLGSQNFDTHCHLIYPASLPWYKESSTDLQLYNPEGRQVANHFIKIPCNGSFYWRYSEIFTSQERQQAGENAYVIIRDLTCRLFGYHGFYEAKGHFSLDHMFGF
ncbi:MAG: hypothetical protein BGO77_05585 [Caedibacter sp. 37-49]|nr:MAG: hypothetical protein BGO77_05585 [Caedibacter sp. 37-49]